MDVFKTTREILENQLTYELIDNVFNYYGGGELASQTKLFKINYLIVRIDGKYKRIDKSYLLKQYEENKVKYLEDLNNNTSYTYDRILDTIECYRIIRNILDKCEHWYISKCEITGLYFDRYSVSYMPYRSEGIAGYCIEQKAKNNSKYIIVNETAHLVSECVNMIVGKDSDGTPLVALRPLYGNNNYYMHEGKYYTAYGAREYDLIVYMGALYPMDECVYCEDTEKYIPLEYAYYDEDSDIYFENESEIEARNGLKSYHRSEIEDKSNGSDYKIGFEIEKEDDRFTNFRELRAIGWDAESDGSLDDDGFEMISPIYDLNDMDEFSSDIDRICKFINADGSSNCGGHINVSVRGKDAKEIFSLIQGYTPLLYAMFPTRIENRYCKAKKVNEFNPYERYEAINFTKGNILEFRIFSRVRNTKQLTWRYKFIQYMFANQRKGAASIVRMLLTDSKLKALLLEVYSEDSYNNLIERVVKFTDIYMTSRDAKTTATLITKMKQGEATYNQLTTI